LKSNAGAGVVVPRVACIANPNARDGKLGKNFHRIEEALGSSGFDYEVFMTEGTGHAIEIASGLRDSDFDLVVAIGGDGTVHEVANGIRGSAMRLGIIPMGNGDDFARAIGIPLKDLQGAVELLKDGTDYTVGGIRVEGLRAPEHPDIPSPKHYPVTGEPSKQGNLVRWSFLECDGGVTSSINRMKDEGHFSWISGQKKYTFLAIRAILTWKSQMAWIKVDEQPGYKVDLTGLFALMQAETFGGGYRVAPGMHPFGESASIVLGFGLSKSQMLRVMGPLEKGKHVGRWGKISMDACRSFEIRALDSEGNPTAEVGHDPPLFISLDGEISMTTPVRFEFHDAQLNVRGGPNPPNR
tara:strand:+ start:459 stop:1520 length:1062 start_codon:yes stop_codon:yes gene_type:complete